MTCYARVRVVMLIEGARVGSSGVLLPTSGCTGKFCG